MRSYDEILADIEEHTMTVRLSVDMGWPFYSSSYGVLCNLDRELKEHLIADDIYNWFYPELT